MIINNNIIFENKIAYLLYESLAKANKIKAGDIKTDLVLEKDMRELWNCSYNTEMLAVPLYNFKVID